MKQSLINVVWSIRRLYKLRPMRRAFEQLATGLDEVFVFEFPLCLPATKTSDYAWRKSRTKVLALMDNFCIDPGPSLTHLQYSLLVERSGRGIVLQVRPTFGSEYSRRELHEYATDLWTLMTELRNTIIWENDND